MKLRSITKHVKDQNWFAVFLDFIIVIFGILIAFQVTNWSQERQENVALDSYLTSITKNIEFDLNRLDSVRKKRIETMSQTHFMIAASSPLNSVEKSTLETSSEIFRHLTNYEYFDADQSAFETFKSSGLLKNIQGFNIEGLIFRYYNLANEIAKKETDYNQTLKDRFSELSNIGLEGMVYVMYPNYIAGETQLETLQPLLKRVLYHPAAIGLYSHTSHKSPELIMRYDNLVILGREIVSIVNAPEGRSSWTDSDALDKLFDIDGNYGYKQPILNGVIVSRFFERGHSASNLNRIEYIPALKEQKIMSPNANWSVFYLRNRSDSVSQRPTKDFSKFKSVRLTMKGDMGGEKVFIAMKDSTDLDDGLESRVPLTLSAEWSNYEISLSEFETADLENIFVPISFIFLDDSKTISIRDIQFVP